MHLSLNNLVSSITQHGCNITFYTTNTDSKRQVYEGEHFSNFYFLYTHYMTHFYYSKEIVFVRLRLFSKVKLFLSFISFGHKICAFITFTVTLSVGVSLASLLWLQLVQNAATPLLTQTKKCVILSHQCSLLFIGFLFVSELILKFDWWHIMDWLLYIFLTSCSHTRPPVPFDHLLLVVPRSRLVYRCGRIFSSLEVQADLQRWSGFSYLYDQTTPERWSCVYSSYIVKSADPLYQTGFDI